MTEKTPSGPAPAHLEHAPCGLVRRLASMAYDSLLVIALLFAAGFVAVIVFGDDVPSGTLWFQFLLLVVWWAYFAVCWKMGGQTVAMRTWRIRLIGADGAAITWTDTVVRFALAFVSAAAAGLGFAWSLFDAQKRGWHDIGSATRLVVADRGKQGARRAKAA